MAYVFCFLFGFTVGGLTVQFVPTKEEREQLKNKKTL